MSEEAFQYLTINLLCLTCYSDLFFKLFESPDIHPFRFFYTLNHDCSIRMDWRDCLGVFEIPGLCFAEYTITPYKYFLTNFVIIINPAFVITSGVKIS